MKTTGSRASAVSQTRGFGDLLYDKAGARPSLDLDFAGTESLRDKITGEYLVDHTRSTTGTYRNSDGLIKEAPVNHLHDTDNPTLWGKGNNTTLTANSFTAPDGTQTAHRVQFIAGQGTYLAIPASAVVANQTYVYSIWLKKNGSNTTTSLFINGATTGGVTDPHYQVTLTDEWQRFTRVFTLSSTTLAVQIDNFNSQAEDFLFWQPQVEKGSVATDYIKTTASQPNSAPRFTHERVETGNLLHASNTFQNWTTAPGSSSGTTTVTGNRALAPDGTYSAFQVDFAIGNGGTSNDRAMLKIPTVATAFRDKPYTASVYLKTTDGTTKVMSLGTISGSSTSITVTGDWQRFENISTPATNLTDQPLNIRLRGNEGTSTSASVYVWGAQAEQSESASTFVRSINTFANRQSNATYVDSAGLIKRAYKNYITFSENINDSLAAWERRTGNQTLNAIVAPDGTQTATFYKPDGNNVNNHYMFQEFNPYLNGTLSVHVKSGGMSHFSLIAQHPTVHEDTAGVSFNLNNGTIHTSHNASGEIIDVGDGWFRVIVKPTTSEAFRYFVMQPHTGGTPDPSLRFRTTYAGNGTDGVYIWGAMMTDVPNNAGDYVKTTNTKSGAARYSHDPETLAPTGLYLEPQAVNYAQTRSQYQYTYSDITAPDGSNTIQDNPADTTLKFISGPLVNYTPVNGQTVTVSYWAKYRDDARSNHTGQGRNNVRFQVRKWASSAAATVSFFYDITTQTINTTHTTAGTTTRFKPYPNGWYRISHTFVTDSAFTNTSNYLFYQYQGGATSIHADLPYVWGVQYEVGSYATSYIPNAVDATSSVTRAADVYTSTANITETFEPRGLLIEESRTNQLIRSDNVEGHITVGTSSATNTDRPWVIQDNPSFSAAGDTTTAPDGSTVPWYNLKNFIYQDSSANTSSGITLTNSVYLKAETDCVLGLRNPAANDVVPADDQYDNGSNSYSKKLFVTTKWQRFSVTGTRDSNSTSGFNRLLIDNRLNLTANTVKIAIWGAQQEVGNFPTSYIYTNASTVNRSPDVATITGDNFGTYRTNLLSNSNLAGGRSHTNNNAVGNVSYGQNCAIIPNYALSPISNKFDASKIIPEPSTSVQRLVWQNFNNLGFGQYTLPNPHTISFYAKGDGCNFVHVRSGNHGLAFNLSNGTTSTGYRDGSIALSAPTAAGTVMEDLGGGWYRCALRIPATNNNTLYISVSNSATTTNIGAVTTNIGTIMYGFQIEAGDKLTNYIPSTNTFTSRLGNATYVDSNGLIKNSVVNLFTRSQPTNANQWDNVGGAVGFTGNYATAPDGTQTAGRVTMPDAGFTYFRRSVPVVAGKIYTFSVYLKSNHATLNETMPQVANTGIAGGSVELVTLTDEWVRYVRTFTATTTENALIGIDNGPRAIDHLVWGFQLEEGDTANEYVNTQSTNAATGAARYSHDPETLVPTGLYLEPAATNHIHHSNHFNNPNNWNYNGGSAALDNSVVAPTGETGKVAVFTEDTGLSAHNLNASSSTQRDILLNSGQNSLSFFVKPLSTRNLIHVRINAIGTNSPSVDYKLDDQTVHYRVGTSNTTSQNVSWTANAHIEKYQNDWYRLVLNYDFSSNSKSPNLTISINESDDITNIPQVVGNGQKTMAFFGLQNEAGSYASSYIDTTGSTVTRNPDIFTSTATTVLDRDGGNKEAFWSPFLGATAYHEHIRNTNNNSHLSGINRAHIFFQICDNNSATWESFVRHDNNAFQSRLRTEAGYQYQVSESFGFSQPQHDGKILKATHSYEPNNAQALITSNNQQGVNPISNTDTSVNLFIVNDSRLPNNLQIGHSSSNAQYLNKPLKRLTFWKSGPSLINIQTITQA